MQIAIVLVLVFIAFRVFYLGKELEKTNALLAQLTENSARNEA